MCSASLIAAESGLAILPKWIMLRIAVEYFCRALSVFSSRDTHRSLVFVSYAHTYAKAGYSNSILKQQHILPLEINPVYGWSTHCLQDIMDHYWLLRLRHILQHTVPTTEDNISKFQENSTGTVLKPRHLFDKGAIYLWFTYSIRLIRLYSRAWFNENSLL